MLSYPQHLDALFPMYPYLTRFGNQKTTYHSLATAPLKEPGHMVQGSTPVS
jgi:hypothetical protein